MIDLVDLHDGIPPQALLHLPQVRDPPHSPHSLHRREALGREKGWHLMQSDLEIAFVLPKRDRLSVLKRASHGFKFGVKLDVKLRWH